MSSSWILFKIWCKKVKKLVDSHKKSNNLLLSKLHLGDVIFETLKLCGFNHIDITNYFTLVEVVSESETIENEELSVSSIEPRLAENWMVETMSKFNVIFKKDLARFLKGKLRLNDIIIVCGGKITYDRQLRVSTIGTNVSKESPVAILILRPSPVPGDFGDDVFEYLTHLDEFRNLKSKGGRDGDTEVLKIFPKGSEKIFDVEGNMDSSDEDENSDSEDEPLEVDNNNNTQSTTDSNSDPRFHWRVMPVFSDSEAISNSDDNAIENEIEEVTSESDHNSCSDVQPQSSSSPVKGKHLTEDALHLLSILESDTDEEATSTPVKIPSNKTAARSKNNETSSSNSSSGHVYDVLKNVGNLTPRNDNVEESLSQGTRRQEDESQSESSPTSEEKNKEDESESSPKSFDFDQSISMVSLRLSEEVPTPEFINATLVPGARKGNKYGLPDRQSEKCKTSKTYEEYESKLDEWVRSSKSKTEEKPSPSVQTYSKTSRKKN